VLLIELNRVHHEIRGIDFDTAILSLLPKHYIFAELRAGGIRQISNLVECADTDFLAVPEERRHELRNIKADRSDAGAQVSDEIAHADLAEGRLPLRRMPLCENLSWHA